MECNSNNSGESTKNKSQGLVKTTLYAYAFCECSIM
ncbi:hypothetical protein T4B_6523 [Trichinella pseudospiralis]|uniref:Uncharacterized protein n=1 Tax=Trichinella pseudospiralis TaxID=6337 RepID=A0A0V1GIM3_TRIPS|nr:hypothetical protein T4B_6523 [Trichinella pseudospiralis]